MANRGLRRVAATVARAAGSLLLAVALSFTLASFTPGDAFTELELDPSISRGTIAALRARYVHSEPLLKRFAHWLVAACRGDFGYSLSFHRSVSQLLLERLPSTLELVTLALAIAWTFAIATALLVAALSPGVVQRALRALVTALGSAVLAVPVGAVAVAALLLAPLGWVRGPSPGISGLPWLPATVLALGLIPAIYFIAFNELAAVLPRSFILAAKARGLSKPHILLRHALPNTLDLLVPLGSITATQLVLEAVIVESLLAWPGIGQLSLSAAAQRDIPLVSALVLISSMLVIFANIVSDLLQWCTNPRLRS